MKQFWQYAQANPRTPTPTAARSVYVLPDNFGEGFRSPDDTIWGLWNADFNSAEGSTIFATNIRMTVATLLQMFGPKLDIIYPRAGQTVEQIGYENVLYWNDPGLIPNAQAMPSQRPAGNESAWQLQTPTPSPLIDSNQYSVGFYLLGVGILISVALFVSVRTIKKKRFAQDA